MTSVRFHQIPETLKRLNRTGMLTLNKASELLDQETEITGNISLTTLQKIK